MRQSGVADGELSDEALLAGMAVGDQSAAVTFTRRYQRRVFGLAYSMTSDAGLAEDVAQEAMVRVWRHAPVFDPRRERSICLQSSRGYRGLRAVG